jgi:CHRD domain
MLRLHTTYLLPLAVLIASNCAYAGTVLFANLTNSQENPPTTPLLSTGGARPASFGTAMFFLNDAQTSMTFTATIFNIDFTGSQTADTFDNLVAAHIHASATVTPTTNAGVVWGFFGSPFNDNNPNDVVITPFATGVGGTISGKWDAPEGNGTTLAAQLPFILSNRAYINFHTTQFGGGEIRGAITVVPEPSTVLLGIAAFAILGLDRRRRRRA